ncbi:MAG: 4Fe-4S binding protein [Dehalogenimonas sp.]|uniref:4Fe-4S binding protein n=1 Tax=Candidatus Dehalogenimonas loeffleri TaxID=3127115 RepID=A0ABZ2J6L7_9CHLR|nr:4Fe-4S binding protein [Dehalogenimonas sp.]
MNTFAPFRRILLSLVLTTAAVIFAATPLLACEIAIKPDKTGGAVGETIKLNVTVELTHRNCPVPMEDTQFKTSNNLALVSQTPWVAAGREVYTTVLTVQILAAGPAKLEIVRDCIKEGGYASITLNAGAGGEADSPVVALPISGDGSSDTGIITTSTDMSSTAELTWPEAFKRALSQPFIWAYLGLTAFAYAALLMRKRRWRFISLAFSMVYLGFFLGLCPCTIGALQNVVLHLGDAKEYLAHFIILAIPVVSTLFLGRIFCGWICPMGAVQQFLYRRDLSYKLPEGLGAKLRHLRFVVLAGIIVAALYTGTTAFAEIDPFKSLFNAQIAPVPTTLLVVLIAASIFIFTPWCRFLCPMGAVLSVIGRFARRELSFKAECKNCGACARTFCDYKAISPGTALPVIAQNECARCGECISRCPRDSMDYEVPRRSCGEVARAPAGAVPELALKVEAAASESG